MQRLDNTPYNQVPHIRRDNRFDSGKLNAYTIFFKLVLMLQPKDEATEVCLIYFTKTFIPFYSALLHIFRIFA